ncbi:MULTISPECIES: hypothetical protein [Paraburkholderia]|uniref:Uncharacterized protein n=1 Tax=Paraburkholderia madseniana TaxID=2599607 RepID=A0AAP5BMQ9_9BURK|nr:MULTISPECIES: hypothetical protein [Paraburkholderia]MCX4152367.1 hypothetical protein [Paraburkholderia madseniana]MCX4177815.1 hypothetical protein [Paraburkholderia madseniana]MDN7155295.1 hypothetical protein [Paraburkholderia sp. WS6]MDQ6414178.1 hypothetical protein [Paraburkholderia madseniana]MDQ6465802.1 hypothetical protein [Paraburkholderia madseniana]
MSDAVEPIDPAQLSREQKLTIIYRHTHRDFKGHAGPQWGEHQGKKSILVNVKGSTCLVLLEHLSDEQIADKLPYALTKEADRRAKTKKAVAK